MTLTEISPGACGPQDGVRGQFRAIVTNDRPGPSAAFDQGRQLARHPTPRDRGVRDCSEALPGDVVDNVEHPEALAVGELVVDEIERPARIGPRLDQDRRPCPDRLAACFAFAHRQPFLAVEPIDPVDAGRLTLAAQHDLIPANWTV
jgi:hypothetical protein